MVSEVNGEHLDRDHSGITCSELLDAWVRSEPKGVAVG
jgi:hypothetical protein